MKISLQRILFALVGISVIIMLSLSGCPGGEEGQIPHEGAYTFLSEIERSTFEKVNAYRQSQGLAPLEINEAMTVEARGHSRKMADGEASFGHDGFEGRIMATGIRHQGAAENVAYNSGVSDPADTAVTGWIGSEGHRRNMAGDFNLTGIGAASNAAGVVYFTQLFIKSDRGMQVQPQSGEEPTSRQQPWWLKWW